MAKLVQVDNKKTSRMLIDKYQWGQYAEKLWVFSPDKSGPNFLIIQNKSVEY